MNEYMQWPETVDEAVDLLLDQLPEGAKAEIAAMSKDDLIGLHMDIGTWIRNNLGLWVGNNAPALLQATQKQHPDDASIAIIEALWKRLQISATKL